MNPSDMEVYGSVKVGERGQVVIPADAREKLGIRPGDILLVVSTPLKEGIAMIKADVVKDMVRKMSLGLSQTDGRGSRRSPRKKKR